MIRTTATAARLALCVVLSTACEPTPEIRAVASGVAHACDLSEDGMVRCWGSDARGQLGRSLGEETGRPEPVDLPRARSLSAGGNTTCVVDEVGRVYCFGQNHHGQLGDRSREDRDRPVMVEGLPAIDQISVGFAHVCALSFEGTVWCWGWNGSGQSLPSGPRDVDEPTIVEEISGAAQVVAGFASTCALDGEGGARCWGDVTSGPVRVLADAARSIAIGADHVCILGYTEMRCFGSFPGGGLPAFPEGQMDFSFEGGEVAAGAIDHLCFTGRSGLAYCWGKNDRGQLGGGSFQSTSAPIPVRDLPAPIRGLAVGDRHSCAAAGGRTWCWGWNDMGQLGDDTGIHTLVPMLVEAGTRTGDFE